MTPNIDTVRMRLAADFAVDKAITEVHNCTKSPEEALETFREVVKQLSKLVLEAKELGMIDDTPTK